MLEADGKGMEFAGPVRQCITAAAGTIGLMLAAADAPAQQQAYTITSIDPLEGHFGSIACGINDAGVVVGDSGGAAAYLWFGGTAMRLPYRPGGTFARATDVNDRGEIVGTSDGRLSSDRGVVWSRNADGVWMMLELGTANGDAFSNAFAINRRGQVVGVTDNGYRSLPALWEPVDDGYRLTMLPIVAGHDQGSATDLEPYGAIAVGTSVFGMLSHAVMWTRPDSDGGSWRVTELGGLVPGAASGADGINSAGAIAGWALGPDGIEHAVVWQDGVIRDLGTLTGKRTYALAINDAGDVVGETWSMIGTDSAFVRLAEDTQPRDLNTLIPPGHSWRLVSATDINEGGAIAGYGVRDGFLHSFMLRPLTMFTDVPSVATAGETLVATVTGATPEQEVWLFAATRAGETPMGGPDTLDIASPELVGVARADATGSAEVAFRFPHDVGGEALRLQAWDTATGRVSDVRLIEKR